MKRKALLSIIIITLALAPCLSWAQSGWTGTDVPWMPYRDTNHIHIIRTYHIDTATLERKLVSTIEYDRHGYQVSPTILLTYNEKGQLVKMIHWHSYADNPYPYQQTQDILYDSHGLMVSSRLVGSDAHYIVREIEYWE